MQNTYQIGRVGQVWAAAEATYGTAPTLASTDAIRHLAVKLGMNPRNRVDSPERHTHPSQLYRFTRRKTADWSMNGIFFPSATINTLPDHSDFLEHALGAKTNVTLSTTVSATPAPTTTVFTVASAAGLVVGDAILVNVTGQGRKVRVITAIAGAALTVAPALPAAPATGDSVKGCVTYKLATAIAKSLTIAHYLTSKNYEEQGCVIDRLKLTFDANEEPMWEASGPAKTRIRPAQTVPAAFTVVGSNPPSGLTGDLRVGAVAFEMLKVELEIQNAMELDNVAYGTSAAQAFYRKGKRKVTVAIDAMDSSDVTLEDAGDNTSDNVILVQCGDTEGKVIAFYCPVVEFEAPDRPDGDETNTLSFKGVAKGSALAGNDEVTVAVA